MKDFWEMVSDKQITQYLHTVDSVSTKHISLVEE